MAYSLNFLKEYKLFIYVYVYVYAYIFFTFKLNVL